MNRLDPFCTEQPRLLACNVYPSIVGRSAENFAAARTHLKLASLLHDAITLPGSLALTDPFVQALTIEMIPFLESGHFQLDLRSSCSSFSQLAAIKTTEETRDDILKMAELLDKKCHTVLLFDAEGTSNQFAFSILAVLGYLSKRARSRSVKAALQLAIETVTNKRDALTLEDASILLNNTYLDARMRAVAQLMYSIEGARVTNSSPVVPFELWQSAFPNTQPTNVTSMLHPKFFSTSDREHANAIVMDYFATKSEQIDRLDAQAILELKSEPLTQRYIRQLDEAIDDAKKAIEEERSVTDSLELALDRAKSIRKSIVAKCERERKSLRRDSWIFGAVSEVGGDAANLAGVGLVKKGLATMARRLAKKNEKLAWLDYTSAPIVTHVSRFREAVVSQREKAVGSK